MCNFIQEYAEQVFIKRHGLTWESPVIDSEFIIGIGGIQQLTLWDGGIAIEIIRLWLNWSLSHSSAWAKKREGDRYLIEITEDYQSSNWVRTPQTVTRRVHIW